MRRKQPGAYKHFIPAGLLPRNFALKKQELDPCYAEFTGKQTLNQDTSEADPNSPTHSITGPPVVDSDFSHV
jgi:hypothetical protein